MRELLQTVLEQPDDLNARLVYADALQDAGDPRGEFIAFQIQGNPAAEPLLKQYRAEWSQFLRPAVKQGYRFINGFIERITLKVSLSVDNLNYLPGYFENTPLREVRFRALGARALNLAAMTDCTSRLTWLDLKHAALSGKSFTELMTGQWDLVERMWLPSNSIGNIGLESLVEANLPRLESVNLHGTRLNDQSLEILLQWPQFPRMTELNLRGNDFSDEALTDFCSKIPQMTRLGLPMLNSESAQALADRDEDLELLVVSGTPKSLDILKERFQDSVVISNVYESPFDIPWP
jgi:uncharacterized protein (TIGR02996 family)